MNLTKPSLTTPPVSIEYLQSIWRRVAESYFGSQLPPIVIEWSTRLTASTGMFVSDVGPRSRLVSQEEKHGNARRIRLSAPLLREQPESEIVRTLAHEMIHQWQFDVKKRFPDHGSDFYEFMERMNQDGLAISVRHTLDREVEKLSKYLWRCLACGTSYRRQRRTISSRRHRCGKCHGKLEEVLLNALSPAQQNLRTPKGAFPHHVYHTFATTDERKPQQLVFDF